LNSYSSHRLSDAERRRIEKLEVQQKVGPPKFLFSSHIDLYCPDCGRKLRCSKASPNKVWIAQCKGYHAWRVSLEGVPFDEPIMQRIPYHHPEYPRRNILNK